MGIFIDQTGYLPVSRKVATTTFPCNFQLIDSTTQHAVYDGVSTDSGMDESAGEQVDQLDFSKVSSPGKLLCPCRKRGTLPHLCHRRACL